MSRSLHHYIIVLLLSLVLVVVSSIKHVESGQVTISGISSGGYMAVQFHVAFSSIVSGAGIIAGGPYYCANNNVEIAQGACMAHPERISVSELIDATDFAASTFTIDPTSNMANSRVWIYSGTKDTVVVPGVVKKLVEYYQHYITDNSRINTTFDIPSEHSFVTDNFGNHCDYLGPAYINNCGFNTAYALLNSIIPQGVNPPSPVNSSASNIVQLDQASFIPYGTALEASLWDYAFAYVPPQCQNNDGSCSVHVAFHGCLQTIPLINDTFYMNTGYNELADSNNMIILYPQAQANPLNPRGCFDWWGFTGTDYASQLGVQMATVKRMIDHLLTNYA
ncbi:hypothetical protein SAMD00019534_096480 [Acytostelium subglobosum LB1]|uniref:hypothetical protein n=1 Tax=Acytostelium subglobosum LB1 TaxID=1410327 RepID=UPI00064494B6|nr:hypothetical protein SAMD00019534_096480 [Acytostelium subglobosum LB1]GAM26473.1 hypothetical protein SAMD00019534_096480 [Acytostelium subglobosum LB1]|eukprot:XP_012750569.1 hypothetical protein SAMD00019534_096480 [Acytostelium subglobosum LB1]